MSGAGAHLFRSHIMQQFATAARGQSRPPLALFGISGQDEEVNTNKNGAAAGDSNGNIDHHRRRAVGIGYSQTNSTSTRDDSSPGRTTSTVNYNSRLSHHHNTANDTTGAVAYNASPDNKNNTTLARMYSTASTTSTLTTSHAAPPKRTTSSSSTVTTKHSTQQRQNQKPNIRHFTSLDSDHNLQQQENEKSPSTTETSKMMQSLIMSRRTIFAFEPSSSSSSMKESLDRAIQCGLNAPNHKKTEPVKFKRLLSPTSTTTALAQIAYQVKLRKNPTCENNQRLAQRKFDKWNTIPGFLVALVSGQPNQQQEQPQEELSLSSNNNKNNDDTNDKFETLPFVGPSTERQLEDYAATCAAIQNIMLSLHAEGVGSKWATGPVIRTRAFRSLIKAQPDEMVVGLLMVGYPQRIPKPPRRLKSMEELLEDL